LRHLVERHAFGVKDSYSPAESFKEGFWLSTFGVLSSIYRIVVFTGIILFVADKFLLAGLVMALICVISWGIVPLFKSMAYLASSPRLARTRPRAVAISICFFALLASSLAVYPFPSRFRAPGVIEAFQYIRVINDTPGYIENVMVSSGKQVRAETPLIELSDRELELEIEAALAQREETLAMHRKALRMERANLEPIRKRLETIQAKLDDLFKQKADLIVRARQAGVWVASDIQDMIGSWLSRGSAIGEIVSHKAFRFSAVVSQDEAAELFEDQIKKAEVRLYGQGGKNLAVLDIQIIPFQQEKLPSAALGWHGGGEVPISMTDETGLKAAEPFFQIYATIQPSADVLLFHRRSGKLRLTLNPKPLLLQWVHKLRQLLQKRYQI
jgi:putative peptide zinc metalloprotease protein